MRCVRSWQTKVSGPRSTIRCRCTCRRASRFWATNAESFQRASARRRRSSRFPSIRSCARTKWRPLWTRSIGFTPRDRVQLSVGRWGARGRRGRSGGGGFEHNALLVVGFELGVEVAQVRVLAGQDVDLAEGEVTARGEVGGSGIDRHAIAGELLEVELRVGGRGFDGEIRREVDAESVADLLRIVEVDGDVALLVRERGLVDGEKEIRRQHKPLAGPAAEAALDLEAHVEGILVVGDVRDSNVLHLERVRDEGFERRPKLVLQALVVS